MIDDDILAELRAIRKLTEQLVEYIEVERRAQDTLWLNGERELMAEDKTFRKARNDLRSRLGLR